MDVSVSFSSLHLIFFLVLSIHLVEKSNSLSIELIHPYSFKSPFYEANLTYSDMIQRLSSRPSRTRRESPKKISSNNTLLDMKSIGPVLEYTSGGYLAKLSLGTFSGQQASHKEYHFHFDTGSDMTWLQCEDCAKPGNLCFHQNGDPYPNRRSSSYAALPCGGHPLCYPGRCIGTLCSYREDYEEGSYSIGILAYETLTFGSSSHQHGGETVRIVIGCGHYNKLVEYGDEAGILGMSWGPHSFVNQISMHSQGRFSYCLPPLTCEGFEQTSSILRFGSDIPRLAGLNRLPIHQYWGDPAYYVDLQDISINDIRLNIPSNYFAKTSPKKGGCVIDTGTTYTFISRPAYKILKQEMIQHLARADSSLRIRGRKKDLDLCYWRYQPFKGYNHLPTVTFHFAGGANLVLPRDIAFIVWDDKKGGEVVCLGISPAGEDNVAIIGAQSQANHVFVFNLPARVIYFGPRNCAQNP